MIELARIKNHDLGIAAFMVGMAFFALLVLFDTAMKTALLADIFTYVFVTLPAQTGLSRLVKFLMTLIAIFFFFGVSLNNITGRNHTPECPFGSRKKKTKKQ
jgi:cytosine/uracil/thiamine/allantoin permease